MWIEDSVGRRMDCSLGFENRDVACLSKGFHVWNSMRVKSRNSWGCASAQRKMGMPSGSTYSKMPSMCRMLRVPPYHSGDEFDVPTHPVM